MASKNDKNKKPLVVTMTPRMSEELKKNSNGNNMTVVFPATPSARRILFQFLRSNALFRRLADAMIWGQVDAVKYSELNEKLDTALKGVDAVLKEADTQLRQENIRKDNKKKVISATDVKPVNAKQKSKDSGVVKGNETT